MEQQRVDPQPVLVACGAILELLEDTDQQGSQLQLRNGFIARSVGDDPLPVATVLLRRSHKSGLPLRLALLLFWLAGSRTSARSDLRSYEVSVEVRTLALALMLDPERAADRRRVRQMAEALATLGLIQVHSNGVWLTVRLLSDLPDGLPAGYVRPGLPKGDDRDSHRDAYTVLPASVLQDGWVTSLSASALVVLLAFRYLVQTRPLANTRQGLFISTGLREQRFGFSESTYYAGCRELEERGVLHSWSQHLRSPVASGPVKVRRAYAFTPGFSAGWHHAADERPKLTALDDDPDAAPDTLETDDDEDLELEALLRGVQRDVEDDYLS